MITNKELNEVSLSPTKKDYYQIWNELIELASKISTRWSPESTNESDPGIVLLKTLTAIADKLNYNIDKNTLEAFMPSATQQESMRKLTEMMGYNMKYYQAAICKVSISYRDSNETPLSDFGSIYFPRFTNIKNEEEDVNYVTTEYFTLQDGVSSYQVDALEGELVECETDNDNIISLTHLDDNHRYLLPETNVAENGVFICNITDIAGSSRESDPWVKVDNLNTQLLGSHVYKFGFDSNENLPYVQFPEDISQLIKDGLRIRYIRTNGLMGNVSAKTLCKLEVPALWGTADDGDPIKDLTADDFYVINNSASINGANPETLNAAYNNFKKTIGTFDTLVTCRDYMNKIYQLTRSQTNTTPLVSNVIVSDIRDDINRATTLCSFDEYGICYEDLSFKDATGANEIEHFDLMLYPFKTIYGLNNKEEYLNSFRIDNENTNKILYDLKNYKTISHNIRTPLDTDIACIKNYLRLKASVTTIKKVTRNEELEILSNIYTSIYENFNCRKIDFGEEIPYDSILEVIKGADARIKDVNLDEPALYTKIMLCDGSTEYEVIASDDGTPGELSGWKPKYNRLALRNILAGRIAAFDYDNDFATSYSETPYAGYEKKYPVGQTPITRMVSKFTIDGQESSDDGYELQENEVIQFRIPNLKTSITYPAYVNYYIKLNTSNNIQSAIPATFITLDAYLSNKSLWEALVNSEGIILTELTEITSDALFETAKAKYGAIFKIVDGEYKLVTTRTADETYYGLKVSKNFLVVENYIRAQVYNTSSHLNGLYYSLPQNLSRIPGYLVDSAYIKYLKQEVVPAADQDYATMLYVQDTHAEDDDRYTPHGLGRDASGSSITKDAEYQLQSNEFLLINYTNSKTDESGAETKSVINKYWGPGTIIKPNFGIISSELYHNNHSYTKRDGFDFSKYSDAKNIEGMFTLDTNEQIEIRDLVKIELDQTDTLLYWNRNDEKEDALSHEFTFNEEPVDINTGKPWAGSTDTGQDTTWKYSSYTLKEGEYLYYTNSKKVNMAYYGGGSIIKRTVTTPRLVKYNVNGVISADDIATNGIEAIPWITIKLDKAKKLTIVENQYITLTEGDTFYGATYSKQTSNLGMALDNEWRSVTGAQYKFAEAEASEPLPEVLVDGLSWQARTRLNFNLNPDTPQILHAKDSITLYTEDDLEVETEVATITPLMASDYEPVAVYANYICQYAYHEFISPVDNLKLKVIKLDEPTLNPDNTSTNGNTVSLGNYTNGDTRYTKFSFESLVATPPDENKPAFKLKINIPSSDKYGLIMFYYIDENLEQPYKKYDYDGETEPETLNDWRIWYIGKYILKDEAYIKITNANAESEITSLEDLPQAYILHEAAKIKVSAGANGKLCRFNIADTDDLQKTFVFDKSNEIYTIKLTPDVTELEVYGDSSLKSILIFSELSLVKDINKKLRYQYNSTNNNTALDTLLADIRKEGVAKDFYYTTPIENENAIELNQYITDVTEDSLLSPATWYDPNNVNNKFVVSEIDANYLPVGITLTRASRL